MAKTQTKSGGKGKATARSNGLPPNGKSKNGKRKSGKDGGKRRRRSRLHLRADPGPRGPRGRPPPARHVHRLHRPARPPPPHLRGRRQRHRRGHGRLLRPRRHRHPRRRQRDRGDNGRGIPIDKHEKTGLSGVETVLTTLHAGGKFGGGVYKVSGGLHGVGASVVNALSSKLEVSVASGGALYSQTYERGAATSTLAKVRGAKTTQTGTTITFLPDDQVFETLDYDFDVLATRFREMAYLTRRVWIAFTDERVRDGDGPAAPPRERSFYFDSGIEAYVRHLNRGRNPLHADPIHISEERDGTMVEVALQYNQSFSETVYSFANCIHTIDGGSPPHRVPRRPHPRAQRVRAARQAAQGRRPQPLRRRRPRGPGRGHLRQARRAPVRGPDQDPARQPRGQGPRRVRRRLHARPAARRAARDRPPHHREGGHRLARPRGPRASPATSSSARGARRQHAARQARRLRGDRPRALRDLPRRGRLGRRHRKGARDRRTQAILPLRRQDPERPRRHASRRCSRTRRSA